MRSPITIAAAIVLATAACTQPPPADTKGASKAEPAPAAAAGVEPRADDLVRQMSKVLAGAAAFTFEVEETWDEIPEHQPRTQLTTRRHAAVKRPNRFVGDATGDAMDRSFWYDGRTVTMLDKAQNTYATTSVPATIDGALDAMFERTGLVVPLGDFVFDDAHGRLMQNVQRGVYLGLHNVGGVLSHHLAFEQELIDWQLWIDAGDQPVPRKLVIAYKAEPGVPQYAVTFHKWNLKADLAEDVFRFVRPEGATRMEFPRPAGPAKSGKEGTR